MSDAGCDVPTAVQPCLLCTIAVWLCLGRQNGRGDLGVCYNPLKLVSVLGDFWCLDNSPPGSYRLLRNGGEPASCGEREKAKQRCLLAGQQSSSCVSEGCVCVSSIAVTGISYWKNTWGGTLLNHQDQTWWVWLYFEIRDIWVMKPAVLAGEEQCPQQPVLSAQWCWCCEQQCPEWRGSFPGSHQAHHQAGMVWQLERSLAKLREALAVVLPADAGRNKVSSSVVISPVCLAGSRVGGRRRAHVAFQ